MIRCTTCGLTGESDSRFCGGCGARMPTIAPGIDPTMMRAPAAVATPVPPTGVATSVLPAAPVVSSGVMAAPSTDLRSTEMKTSVRASGRIAPPASNAQASMNDSLAVSMSAVPRRRIGVFLAALLIFDAGLATAGALMMRSALGRASGPASAPPAVIPSPPPVGEPSGAVDAGPNPGANSANPAAGKGAIVPTAAVPATAVPVTAVPIDTATIPADPKNSDSGATGALGGAAANVQISPDKTTGAGKDADKSGGKNPGKKTPGAGPVDPYATAPALPLPVPTPGGSAGPALPVPTPVPAPSGEQTAQEESIADQVRRREVGSRARFARCYSIAAKASDTPLAGAVTVAFQVTAQGRVSNASAVDNSTESLSLARCVVAEVSKWTFDAGAGAGAGEAQDFVRVIKFEGQ